MKRKIVNKKLYMSLVISFCIIILFSIILTAVGVKTIIKVKDDYSYTIDMPENKIHLLKDIKTEFMTMRYRVANYVMNSGDSDYIYNTANQQYEASKLSLLSKLDAFIQLNHEDDHWNTAHINDSIKNAKALEELIMKYHVYAEKVMELSLDDKAKEADDILKEAIPIAEASLGLLDIMIDTSNENIRLVSVNVDQSARSSVIFLVILALVLVSFSGVLSHLIIKAIANYIRELRNAEYAAEEASRLKSVFLANMSHEIRTPMNSIIGFSELALDDNISLRSKDYLEKIKASSEGLLQIINDILDSSKIEAGKMTLENIPFSLNEVFRSCQIIMAPKASDKKIMLYCYAEPPISKMLLGDPTKLRQILLNLLSNAIKFTNVGIIKLLAIITETKEDSVTVHIEVKDSGIGMTPEQIDKIFEPFVQADDGTTRKYGGTGLGLSITNNIVKIMGGELIVESTLGVGSKFSFDLTFQTIDMPIDEALNERDNKQLEKPVFQKGEVLVCEDNALNQQVISENLSRVGLKTTIAVNGREGVEYVAKRLSNNEPPFDLIFMDIHMPVMDGIEAVEELNRIGNKTPIVALTANIMQNNKDTYRILGMSECLAKPFTTKELWACLLRYITPQNLKEIDYIEQSKADKKLHNQLLLNFYNDNQTTFIDIDNAIQNKDIKLAHRLAHTLKGVAGLIGESALKEAANNIECSLAGESFSVTNQQMQVLERELNSVLKKLELMTDIFTAYVPPTIVFNKKEALEVIEILEPMLKHGNIDCLDMIEQLMIIPDSKQLIEQIENFNFAQASHLLTDIKSKLERE